MTHKIGNTTIIAAEPVKSCTECGTLAECRPYGKGGAQICFDCATSSPEKEARAASAFKELPGSTNKGRN